MNPRDNFLNKWYLDQYRAGWIYSCRSPGRSGLRRSLRICTGFCPARALSRSDRLETRFGSPWPLLAVRCRPRRDTARKTRRRFRSRRRPPTRSSPSSIGADRWWLESSDLFLVVIFCFVFFLIVLFFWIGFKYFWIKF